MASRVDGRRTPHRAGSFCNLRSHRQLVLHRSTAGTGARRAGSCERQEKTCLGSPNDYLIIPIRQYHFLSKLKLKWLLSLLSLLVLFRSVRIVCSSCRAGASGIPHGPGWPSSIPIPFPGAVEMQLRRHGCSGTNGPTLQAPGPRI